ncbi:MAG TPA: tetratricopeptide repeat protein [Candidatus Cloacimonadota bacterium]|nr:tetratricopeptide repeat protein [Candidatus Cloacimonadota bacterium]
MPKPLRPALFALLLLSLLFTGCAVVQSKPVDGSRPNFSSLYYFITGSYSLHQGRLELARQLLEKAQAHDPRSQQISKYLLLSRISLYDNDLLSKAEFEQELQKTRQQMDLDLYTLNSLYSVYSIRSDSLGLDLTLKDLERNYPSSRIHILRFYYNYRFKGEVDTKALERAEKLAKNEPEDLLLLAQIYSSMNPIKALQLVDQLLALQPSDEAKQLQESILKSIDLYAIDAVNFDKLNYPEHKAQMLDHLQTLQKEGKSGDLLELTDRVCATGDAELILPLAATAFFEGNVLEMHKIALAMEQKTPQTAADSKVYALVIANSLTQHEQTALSRYTARVSSVADLESVLVYYLYYFAHLEGSTPEAMPPALHDSFHERFANACDDEDAKLYLKAFSHAFLAATTTGDFSRSKASYSQSLINRGSGSEADFSFLSSYYYMEDRLDDALDVLRLAVQRFPDNAEFLNGLGYSLLSFPNKLEEALPLIRQALALQPDNPAYLDSIAWYYYLKQDYYSALEYMRIPLRQEKLNSEIAWHIGMIYKALGRQKEAQDYFQKAVDASDNNKFERLAQEELDLIKN